jgi:competence protein ComEC
LLAPHHGSARSDPPGFASWCTPEWVVVSSGNADVRPALATYQRAGALTFQTNQTGAVEFAISRTSIQAETWASQRLGLPPLEQIGGARNK